MSKRNKNKKKQLDLLDQSTALFERTEIPFGRSQEESWKVISSRIYSINQSKDSSRHIYFGKRSIALAATLTLLLSVGTFLRLYREKIMCPQGENITFELPDGSLAELNENTKLYVHPLWWSVSRRVYLEGEAFFNVNEGTRFEVVTSLGTTEVLGTTFTVYAREDRFSVTCHSGRVMVNQASSEQSVTLSQNERADLMNTGVFEVRKVRVDRFSPAWKAKLLKFTSAPLRQVFDVIEEQYGVQIDTPEDIDHIYTGNLTPDQSVENIISLICRPFGLVYEKRSGTEYLILTSTVD